MKAAQLSDTANKLRLHSRCEALFQLAERLKHDKSLFDELGTQFSQLRLQNAVNQVKFISTESTRRLPASTRKLTTGEQIIVLKGSQINDLKFPPWQKEHFKPSLPSSDEDPWTDTHDLALSNNQLSFFSSWKRATQLFSTRSSETLQQGPGIPISSDLVQDVTTDCSVVASLSAIISRQERGFSRLIVSSLANVKDKSGDAGPNQAQTSRINVRLYFNGAYRKVEIDNRLPFSNGHRSLYVRDKNDPSSCWPAFVEKAYLKVRGGYDFPGSNSGTDLWILTGWIPEQIRLRDDMVSDEFWTRMSDAYHQGDVLITLGTPKLTSREEKYLGLVGEHSYAIIDMVSNIDDQRMVLIKNPWSRGVVSTVSQQPSIFENGSFHTLKQGQRKALPEDAPKPGLFWIPFDSLVRNFESVFLNWNPALFSHLQDIHFIWPIGSSFRYPEIVDDNPQFAISTEESSECWLLLSRHIKTGDHVADTARLGAKRNYIGLSVFDSNGREVFLSNAPTIAVGDLISSPQTLMRVTLAKGKRYTVLVYQEDLEPGSYAFTLQAFAYSPINLMPVPRPYTCVTLENSAWNATTAGGDASSATYFTNPQFSLKLSTRDRLLLFLESANQDLLIHIQVVLANGERVHQISQSSLACTSGLYRRGCAVIERDIMEVGTYTIVCSTFSPSQQSEFKLKVGTVSSHELKAIPNLDAGLLSQNLETAFAPDISRVVCPLRPSRLTRMSVILTSSPVGGSGTNVSPMRLSIAIGLGINSRLVASTSPKFDAENSFRNVPSSGLRLENIDLMPQRSNGLVYGSSSIVNEKQDHPPTAEEVERGYWLVIERAVPELAADMASRDSVASLEEAREVVNVRILSEYRIHTGPWGEERE
jgi:calpain-7